MADIWSSWNKNPPPGPTPSYKGSLPAKKAKAKARAITNQKKKSYKDLTKMIGSQYSQPLIEKSMFSFSQEFLFHPQVYKFLTWAHPALTRGERVPKIQSLFWTTQLVKEIRKRTTGLRKLKLTLKKFFHHWRHAHLRIINTEDMVTLERPQKPVFIVDWKTRSATVFEAYTISRDITERLMSHDGLFESSQPPRNPYTNAPLTLAQAISVWNQLYQHAIPTSTAFAAYRQTGWNHKKFLVDYATMLKLAAFRKTMRDTSHEDYLDRMKDFIRFAYDSEFRPCNISAYGRALTHYKTNPMLKAWAALCTHYYEIQILYHETSDHFRIAEGIILDKASKLIEKEWIIFGHCL